MIKTGSEVVCVLKGLLRQAPSECFTLGWLMSNLQQRSFGIVLLFLGLLATIPMGSTVPGVMLAAVALQMIAGRRELVFPRFITARRMPTRYLLRVGGHAIRVMQYIEKAFHPRWPTFFEAGQALCRHRGSVADRRAASYPCPIEQRSTGNCDRAAFACLFGARRPAALFRPSCGAHPDKRRVSSDLGNDCGRAPYRRLVVNGSTGLRDLRRQLMHQFRPFLLD